jgi:hypothetical protein
LAEFRNFGQQAVHHGPSEVPVSHFPASKCDGGFDLVPILQKSHDVILLHIEIVLSRTRPEFNFLELDRPLVLARIVLALTLLVEEFSVVDYTADRGNRAG